MQLQEAAKIFAISYIFTCLIQKKQGIRIKGLNYKVSIDDNTEKENWFELK